MFDYKWKPSLNNPKYNTMSSFGQVVFAGMTKRSVLLLRRVIICFWPYQWNFRIYFFPGPVAAASVVCLALKTLSAPPKQKPRIPGLA